MDTKRIKNLFFASRELYGGYQWQMAAMILLGLVSGFVEAAGIGTLIPIFSFVVKNGEVGDDFISRTVFQIFSYFNFSLSVRSLLVFAVGLFLLKAVLTILFSLVNTKIMADYEKRMKEKIYKNALSASWSYLLKQKVGYLERILFTNVSFVSRLFQQIANNILGFSSFLMYAFVAFKLAPKIAFFALAIGIIVIFVFKPLFVKTKVFADKRKKSEEQINHLINENIVGIKTIKAMGVEKRVRDMAGVFFEKLREMRVKLSMYKAFGSSFVQPIGFLFISTMFAVFYKRPDFNFAVFIAVMYLIQRIFQYVEKIQGSLYVISESVPYVASLIHFEEELAQFREVNDGEDKFIFEHELEVKNLVFQYNNGSSVLSGVNFKIKKGEMVGVIGPSGAGKTTLVDILLRLFQAQSGEILIDKKSIQKISISDWRRNVGYVSQDIFLKNDTIKENISFFENIQKEDIEYAARLANIYDFIKNLPEGFESVVGERGVLLSAGQRQRIVLARALARKPKILILDEATSALDNESEKLIKQSIDSLKGELTVIVIAHRLSTIMSADKLIAIENGKIVEEGVPKELLENKSSYFYRVYDIVE